jgi:predicted nucleic acid-binding protein
MARVYLETSFFSACVSTRMGATSASWRASSLDWWNKRATKHELFISTEVVAEISSAGFQSRDRALAMLRGLKVLELTPEVFELAEHLVVEKVMPAPSVSGDAIHVSTAILNRIEYLLSWNVKHLANQNKKAHLAVICLRLKMPPPRIVTPDAFMGI